MSNRYIQHYESLLNDLENQSLRRKLKVSDSPSGPMMKINGQDVFTFCSNDYLGLANHPEIASAMIDGINIYGGGSGASHMISGHYTAHDQLEQALAATQAKHIPNVKGLFFSTGYMANMAAITGISAGLGENQTMRGRRASSAARRRPREHGTGTPAISCQVLCSYAICGV